MDFVSYAQNLEDVMLYRALKYIEHGFYIDVGAGHPVDISVTKAFYDRGWRGINFEPEHEYFRLLEQERSEDVNLNVAVGDYQGEAILYEATGTGLSTMERTSADLAAGAGFSVCQITVPCTTLAAVCREREIGTVHFLKIDVEGAEKVVLDGCDFGAFRPWIIVVEANEPNSTRDVSEVWEPLIVSKGYDFVYYDGLNRFYLAEEHPELRQSFASPPNVFDRYVLSSQIHAQEELAETQKSLYAQELRVAELESLNAETQKSLYAQELRVAELESIGQERLHQINTMEEALAERNTDYRNLERALADERGLHEAVAAQLQEVYDSHAWRATAPFRKVKDGIIRGARRLLQVLVHHERIRRLGVRLLAGRPGLKSRLRRLTGPVGAYVPQPKPGVDVAFTLPVSTPNDSLGLISCPVSVRTVYRQLLACRCQSNHEEENT